jgi:cation:H+ antiporter
MDFLREKIQMALIFFLTLPWLVSLLFQIHYPPLTEALLSGIAIVAAAFIISWAAETAEMDVPRSFSLALVALLAVLPEYAVDAYFAWMAGQVGGEYIHYATANMTGANRLLIGIGWSMVILYALLKFKAKEVRLDEGLRLETFFLFVATIYAFILPVKGSISVFDTVVFVSMYLAYIYLATRSHCEEFEAVGVTRYLCTFPRTRRRITVVLLFLFSGFVIFVSVEAFSEGLLGTARMFSLDEFLMVQWIAPLASEAPELIVAVILVERMRTSASMNALISSKVNQWTLLIGTIAIVFSISSGSISALPLDQRQSEEVFLTAAQSLFAAALILDLRFTWKEAFALLFLFAFQLAFPSVEIRWFVSFVYLAASVPILIKNMDHLKECFLFVRRVGFGGRM